MISKALLVLIVGGIAAIAHAMCFTDSHLGGYIPFTLYVGAPILTYFIGKFRGTVEFALWLKSKGVVA